MVDKRGSVFDANDWAGLWCWVGYGVIAFAVGLPQFIPFFGRVSSNHSFIRFVTVWSTMRSPGPVSLWFKALGLYVPLFALSAALLSRTRPTQWYFYVGFTVVFVEANFIIFQPWEMDNTKVFYIWVFGASVYITSLLRSFILLGRGRIFLIALLSLIAGATYITLTTSGVLCAVQETVSNSEMFDLVDVEYALWVRDNTPPDAVFMVPSEHYPRHFRVVRASRTLLACVASLYIAGCAVLMQESALAGRAVLAGYAGWLSSHGLDYGKRYNDMNDMMVGAGDTYNWLLRYNVTHITVPWKLRRSFNVEYLNSIATRVTSNGRYTVFEVARDELTDPFKPCGGTNGAVFTNEKPCREAGCTWLPRFSGVKCQMPHGLASGERVNDCGSPGEQLTEDTCHDKWCGWFPNYKGPWCQSSSHRAAGGRHRKFEPMPILTPDYDCGWHGMDVQQCIDRGCTWTPAGSNPWCTYKGPNSKSADIINQIEPM